MGKRKDVNEASFAVDLVPWFKICGFVGLSAVREPVGKKGNFLNCLVIYLNIEKLAKKSDQDYELKDT